MSKKKAGGSKASQHVNPAGKRLGTKVDHGQSVKPGMILVRQRGTSFAPGVNVRAGRDHTLYSLIEGTVEYRRRNGKKQIAVLPN